MPWRVVHLCLGLRCLGLSFCLHGKVFACNVVRVHSHGLGLILAPATLVSVLCFSAVCSAIFADEMATLINLIGSVLCMNIAFVMPTACYWQLAGESSSLFEKSRYAGLIFMGAVFAVLGLLSAACIDL